MVQQVPPEPGTSLPPSDTPAPPAPPTFLIKPLETAEQLTPYLPSLRALLQVNVNDDPTMSSIGFRAPLSDDEADAFWLMTAKKLDDRPLSYYWFVLTATPESTEVLATAAISAIPKPTHLHRAEIVKVLVHPSQQRKGYGAAIMRHAEAYAKHELRKEILTLDTATETPAMAFYQRLGWREWGTCPEYADFADGRRGDATFFVKIVRDP